MFTDCDLSQLGFAARWFFVGLLCQADREGRLEDKPQELGIRIIPFDMLKHKIEPENLLSELNGRFITRYSDDDKKYIQINNFSKHQTPHVTELPSKIPCCNKKKRSEMFGAVPKGTYMEKEKEKEKEKDISPAPIDGQGKQDNVSSFHIFMDNFLRDQGLKPGCAEPKELEAVKAGYRRHGRAGKDILALARGDPDKAYLGVVEIGSWLSSKGLNWSLETIGRWFTDWLAKPEVFRNADGTRK